MIDFPNSPTLNQIFTAAGKSWTWEGTAWVATAATLAAVATSGDYNDLLNKPTFSSAVTSVAGKTGAVTLAITDVASLQSALDGKQAAGSYATAAQGAKADTASQPGHTHAIADVTNLQTSLAAKADLVSGLVPASQLPSYVDDVLEFAALGNFPATGESGKIYVATGTGKIYRWSGSAYVEIIASPGSTDAVPEGSSNLYFTTARASAAAPVQSVAGKTGAVTLAIADVPSLQTSLDAKIAKNSSDSTPVHAVRCMTQGEYDALGTYDPNTLYFIK